MVVLTSYDFKHFQYCVKMSGFHVSLSFISFVACCEAYQTLYVFLVYIQNKNNFLIVNQHLYIFLSTVQQKLIRPLKGMFSACTNVEQPPQTTNGGLCLQGWLFQKILFYILYKTTLKFLVLFELNRMFNHSTCYIVPTYNQINVFCMLLMKQMDHIAKLYRGYHVRVVVQNGL